MTETQVNASHYSSSNYDSWDRWISYWYQIQAVLKTKSKNILEVGCGSGVFSNYVRENLKLKITTFDFDSALKPDVVGDLKNIKNYFDEKSFDCICLFQVLEHLPFENFESILSQLPHITRQHILISLPYYGHTFSLKMTPGFDRFSQSWGVKAPKFKKWKFDGQHYWEIGIRNYPLKRIINAISRHLVIKHHYFCKENPYHYFFECEINPPSLNQ